ncbi:putative acid phosphatase [Yarrowia sp. C11]|nr:putative acid phosphatase [Yarrowia sp. C11]
MKIDLALVTLLASAASAAPPRFSKIQPSPEAIASAAATAKSNHWKDEGYETVKGEVFDKYYQIWLENTNYDKAFGQADLKALTEEGILLTNYWSLTHPSQPNYIAAVSGDYFGDMTDSFKRVPEEVATVADLLDTRHISWGEYQEHQPYTGYDGYEFTNDDGANDYMRKHNPLINYDSVANNKERLGNLKNFTEFYKDLKNEDLPQWAFITPNMTNDGHDSDIEVAGKWSSRFIRPLLKNPTFYDNNLIILTFDENHNYFTKNRVYAVLLGGAIPDHLKGTTDDTFYDHYTNLATVQANWKLPHLGRKDVNANIFKFVADKLDIENEDVDTTWKFNNIPEGGYFQNEDRGIPAPEVNAVGRSGNRILPSLKN